MLASAGGDKLCLSDPRPTHRADILSLSLHRQGKEVEAVAVSPDGSLLVSGGRDGLLVLMTLMVPSIIPRSDSNHMRLTSSVLRKSRVIRERSYIYDATAGDDIPLELQEEEEEEENLEDEMADQFLHEPKKTEKTTVSRMKRRSRFEEKETELPDYATVRKRTGKSAKTAREKRTKGKSYDIPTMVAHLSAAVRVYGPEEPNSSSDSEGEEERGPRATELETRVTTEDPRVDILTHIKAWSNPENISSLPIPRTKPHDLPKALGKAKTHKQFFESGEPVSKLSVVEEREEQMEEQEEQSEGGFLQRYGHLLPAELENTLQTSYSPAIVDHDSLQPQPSRYDLGNSYRLEDLMAVNSEDSLLQWSNSPIVPTGTAENIQSSSGVGSSGPSQFTPSLPTQLEEGAYSDDDVVSMI